VASCARVACKPAALSSAKRADSTAAASIDSASAARCFSLSTNSSSSFFPFFTAFLSFSRVSLVSVSANSTAALRFVSNSPASASAAATNSRCTFSSRWVAASVSMTCAVAARASPFAVSNAATCVFSANTSSNASSRAVAAEDASAAFVSAKSCASRSAARSLLVSAFVSAYREFSSARNALSSPRTLESSVCSA